MADRTAPRERLVAKLSSLTDAEVAELLDYVTIMESLRTQADSPRQFEEELIALLTEHDRRYHVDASPTSFSAWWGGTCRSRSP